MVDADLELEGLEAPGEGKGVVDEKFGDWHDWGHQVVSMGR
jgi:GDPmannose 4,6-dehydratase